MLKRIETPIPSIIMVFLCFAGFVGGLVGLAAMSSLYFIALSGVSAYVLFGAFRANPIDGAYLYYLNPLEIPEQMRKSKLQKLRRELGGKRNKLDPNNPQRHLLDSQYEQIEILLDRIDEKEKGNDIMKLSRKADKIIQKELER